MSLDITLKAWRMTEVFDTNITHNLGLMADEAGIYLAVWRPEEIGIKVAADMIHWLEDGLKLLKSDPERFKKLEPSNKWGTYEDFVPWLEEYLKICQENPDAAVEANR